MGTALAAAGSVLLAIGFAALVVHEYVVGRALRRLHRSTGLRSCRRSREDCAERGWGAPFGTGSQPRATGKMVGVLHGRPLVCFTWQRRVPTPAGDPRDAGRIELYGVLALTLCRPVPRMQVRRRGGPTALQDLPGLRAAPTGDARFDARFEVLTEDATFTRAVLSGHVREYLLASALPGFRLAGRHLLVLEPHGLPLRGLEIRLAGFAGLAARLSAGAGASAIVSRVDATGWDERYRSAELVWGVAPNRWVAEELEGRAAGAALDLACGEGRNAIWLARQGWRVIGVDFSAVAIEKARLLEAAELPAPAVEWVVADATTFAPSAPVDLALLCYLHLPADRRRTAVRRAAAALAPGGVLLVVGHDSHNLTDGTGGPQDPAVLFTAGDIAADLGGTGLVVEKAVEVLRPVDGAPRPAIDALLRAVKPR